MIPIDTESAGLPYRLREQDGGWRLDLYVPDTERGAASVWLSAESIRIPPSGWLRLETESAAP
jgi:hypothetical protein